MPLYLKCRLLVIGLQSASVRALIRKEDLPLSRETTRIILLLNTGEIVFGPQLDLAYF